uniref:Uncharacterized protein n=1 Tax=Rhizophora mucronata TaxID=61149 RepID=A0A2P2PKS2_RHIMU
MNNSIFYGSKIYLTSFIDLDLYVSIVKFLCSLFDN